MNPILFSSDHKLYNEDRDSIPGGLGRLSDAISCEVRTETNSEYELVMEYPVDGALFDRITDRSLIVAHNDHLKKLQPFRVYRITSPISGVVTIYAEHDSYALLGIPVEPYEAIDVSTAMSGIKSHSLVDNPFEFVTDKTTDGDFKLKHPASARQVLGGMEGSLLDTYHGEYEFDWYTVNLWNHRGADNGFRVTYGRNMTDYEQDRNCAECFTGAIAYYYDMESEECVYTPVYLLLSNGSGVEPPKYECSNPSELFSIEQEAQVGDTLFSTGYWMVQAYIRDGLYQRVWYIRAGKGDIFRFDHLSDSDHRHNWTNIGHHPYDHTKIATIDLTTYFETKPTQADLVAKLQSYLNSHQIGVPKVSWKVNFAQLENTSEYKDVAVLETVGLGDTVHVYFEKYNVEAEARVVSTVWDVLAEQYVQVELGSVRSKITDTINSQSAMLAKVPTESVVRNISSTISESLTRAMLGLQAGSIRFLDTNGDDEFDTLYIADNPDPNLAMKVWRFNYQGFAASSNGYNGPFVMGATLDDGLLATFVTAANLIAGTITSADGESFYLNLDTSDMSMKNGTILMTNSITYTEADYTSADRTRLQNIIVGAVTPTEEDLVKYDLNADGKLTITDMTMLVSLISSGNSMTMVVDWSLRLTTTGLVIEKQVTIDGTPYPTVEIARIAAGGITGSSIGGNNGSFTALTADSATIRGTLAAGAISAGGSPGVDGQVLGKENGRLAWIQGSVVKSRSTYDSMGQGSTFTLSNIDPASFLHASVSILVDGSWYTTGVGDLPSGEFRVNIPDDYHRFTITYSGSNITLTKVGSGSADVQFIVYYAS